MKGVLWLRVFKTCFKNQSEGDKIWVTQSPFSLGVETVKSNLEELISGTQICDSNPRYTVPYLVLCKKQARILCSLRFASECE